MTPKQRQWLQKELHIIAEINASAVIQNLSKEIEPSVSSPTVRP